jgi:hypothetical protein
MDAYHNAAADFAELSSIGLISHQVVCIEEGRGLRLRVESGAIWITQEGCDKDVVVDAGETCILEHHGRTLVTTAEVPFALVSIEPHLPVRRSLIERLGRFWAALYAPRSRPTTAAL